jgi:hypothetical protein
MESQSRVRAQSIRRFQMATKTVEISWRRGKQACHQIPNVSSTRPRAQNPRFRQQILELNEEFRGVVSGGVEGKRLRKNSYETSAVLRDFEADFSSMKGKGKAKGELKSLDPQLETRERRANLGGSHIRVRMRRCQLENPIAGVLAGLVILLDRARELNDPLRRRF